MEKEVYNYMEKELYFANSWRTRVKMKFGCKKIAIKVRKNRYWAGAMVIAFFLAVAVGSGVGVSL